MLLLLVEVTVRESMMQQDCSRCQVEHESQQRAAGPEGYEATLVSESVPLRLYYCAPLPHLSLTCCAQYAGSIIRGPA